METTLKYGKVSARENFEDVTIKIEDFYLALMVLQKYIKFQLQLNNLDDKNQTFKAL